jgi:hypothetical protein
MPCLDTPESIDSQLKSLRSSISDLGGEIDSYKAKTAAALGASVFLILLAAGAAYDLFFNKSGLWLLRGITREALVWILVALTSSSILLLAIGLSRRRRRDTSLEARLDELEREYAELLERKSS